VTPRPGSAEPSAGSGLVVVDKPAGLTSHDVVARVRRLAHTRKVGHAGTLDPMATGVLLLGVEKGTRLLGHLALSEKSYDATVRLGASTTTDDAEGEVLTTAPVDGVTEAAVREVLAGFVGAIEQVPSAVSAVKVDGRRAYARVRAGEHVELPARPVTIHDLSVGELRRNPDGLDVTFSVRCSSGTYVRAIARDLGAALRVGGHLTALRRTAVGPFRLAEATPLDRLVERGDAGILPLREVVGRFFPTVTVDAEAARDVGFGRFLSLDLADAQPGGEPVAVLDGAGEFLALYRRGDERGARPVSVFV
jgi:tRNA pseudouridine55 synthase